METKTMTALYYLVRSPTDPNDQDTYIYYNKSPRFHARVTHQGVDIILTPVDNLENADTEAIKAKLNKMKHWYINTLKSAK